MDDPTHHISTAGAAALYTSLTMIAMTWITIGLRFYTRKFIVCRVGTDDWAILVTGVGASDTIQARDSLTRPPTGILHWVLRYPVSNVRCRQLRQHQQFS